MTKRQIKLPPAMVLNQSVELPSEEVMKQLDLGMADMGDFTLCMRIIILQMDNMTMQAACDTVGISKRTLYEKRWQDLMAKARRMFTGYLMQGVSTAANRVYEAWPQIIESMINVALNGARDHEKVQAAELLYEAYILPIQEAPKEDSKEIEYLRKPKNFNPQQAITNAIQVNEGGTLIINDPKNS